MLSLCRLCHQDALPSAGRYKHNIYSSRPNSSPSSWKSLPSLAHGGVSPTTFPSSSWHRLPYHVCGCTLPCLVLFFFFFHACMCSCPPPVARIKDFLLFGSFPPPYTLRWPITRACQRGSISRQGGHTGQNQSQVPRLRIASVWLRK